MYQYQIQVKGHAALPKIQYRVFLDHLWYIISSVRRPQFFATANMHIYNKNAEKITYFINAAF